MRLLADALEPAERNGRPTGTGPIGVAFSLQSWLLVFAFVIVLGAVVGAVVKEKFGVIDLRLLRERR